MTDAIKYPKTPRIMEVLRQDLHREWRHHRAVVEEKVDGANTGIWFEGDELRLQSRGHVLRGGAEERQFAPFHGWAAERHETLHKTLGTRYVLYGEWCFAQNKAFYDALPDWFIGYDILDREADTFLPTTARDPLLRACRASVVPCLWSGTFGKAPAFGSFLGPSKFKTKRWRAVLLAEAIRAGVKEPLKETDDTDMAEGVYVRIEDDERVIGRMKLHREGYEKVRNDNWKRRPLIRNARCRSTT